MSSDKIYKVGRFEKVSYDQFLKDWNSEFGEDNTYYGISARTAYCELDIPTRSTSGSAGYDFHSPVPFTLNPGEEIKIPTGIRAFMIDGFVMMIFPRSSLGFKYRLQLANSVGIVDEDYVYSDNEGHIWIKFVNNGNKRISIEKGDKIAQGIFVPFGITFDDKTEETRNGGIGSTGA